MITLPYTDKQLTGGLTNSLGQPHGYFGLLDNIAALVAQLNAGSAFTSLSLATPVTNDPIYDGQPIAALTITNPLPGTTRNFVSGIWVVARGTAIDKGRGIMVSNVGASDGIYVQNDGVNSTGIASLLTTSATNGTGMVIGTVLASQNALVLRQETALLPAAAGVLLTLTADGAVTEMVRIGSALAAQVGFVFRMFGAGSVPINVLDGSSNSMYQLNNTGSVFMRGSQSIQTAQAPQAGGTAAGGYLFSSVANFGTFFGTGAPTISAALGSHYYRRDGSGVNNRAYINIDGGTTWTAIVTVA